MLIFMMLQTRQRQAWAGRVAQARACAIALSEPHQARGSGRTVRATNRHTGCRLESPTTDDQGWRWRGWRAEAVHVGQQDRAPERHSGTASQTPGR